MQNQTETQHVYARFVFVEPLILLCSDQNLLPCERSLYRTLRRVYVPLLPKPLAQLNEALWAWVECVYHNRVHSELPEKQTPLQVFSAAPVTPADPLTVARAFLWRYERKVSSNNFVSLLGNSYSVDPRWSGQDIELRLDPFDLTRVDVYRDRRKIGVAQIKKCKVGHLLEIEPFEAVPPIEPTGMNYLQILVKEHRDKLARETGHLEFAKMFERGVERQ